MPRMSWGEKSLERTEAVLKVLLNHHNCPQIEAHWDSAASGQAVLKVTRATKKDLILQLTDYDASTLGKKLRKEKNWIQTALKQLEILGFLQDDRDCKLGRSAENLQLSLILPSRKTDDILDAFREKWKQWESPPQTVTSREGQVVSYEYENEEISIHLRFKNPNAETVTALIGILLKLNEQNPSGRSGFNQAREKSWAASSDHSQAQEELNILGELLNSEIPEFRFRAAVDLGRLEPDFNAVEILDNYLSRVEASVELEPNFLPWQVALSLGKLNPHHPQAATARNLQLQFSEDLDLELLVASRVREDGELECLVQLYPSFDLYLPPGMKLEILDQKGVKVLLDPEEQTFLERVAQAEEMEMTTTFVVAPGEPFQIRVAHQGISVTENLSVDF